MPSTSHAQSSDSPVPAAPETHAVRSERAMLARRILLEALLLGGLGDSLLRQGPGLGLFLWIIAFGVTVLRLVRHRGEGVRREQI